VSDTLPGGVTFVSTTGCAEGPAGVPTCNLGAILAGGSAQYTIEVTVDASTTGTITNSVSVSSDTTDPVPGNDSTTEDTTVTTETGTIRIVKNAGDVDQDFGFTSTGGLTPPTSKFH